MLLYHGSTVKVEKPELRNISPYHDFGAGFYTTSSYEQAERWARVKMRREGKNIGYVSVYEFDYEAIKQDDCIEIFNEANEAWLNFVVNNRKGMQTNSIAELHIGPVADDNVYASIRLFETGVYDVEETLKRLKTEVLKDQWVFHSVRLLARLKCVEVKEVTVEVSA